MEKNESREAGKGDTSLRERALHRGNRFRRDIREIMQRFDNITALDSIGRGQVGFGEAYLKGSLGFAIRFNIGEDKFWMVVTSRNFNHAIFYAHNLIRTPEFSDLKTAYVCGEEEISVLVRVCESINGPYREVVGLGRLYRFNDETSEGRRLLSQSFEVVGGLKLLDFLVDGEMNAPVSVFGRVYNLADCIVITGSNRLNYRSGKHGDSRGDWQEFAPKSDAKLLGFGVMVGHNFVSLFSEEVADSCGQARQQSIRVLDY